jgi:hypothetical protein
MGADFLRTIAEKHSLDLDHVVTMGHSSGGIDAWKISRY